MELWDNAKYFDSFLVIVLTEENKTLAFFVPHRFEKTEIK